MFRDRKPTVVNTFSTVSVEELASLLQFVLFIDILLTKTAQGNRITTSNQKEIFVINMVTSRIRALPENVANQIAAGEVVERPASIIKELVENSLDAGATSILVSLRNGGKSMVEVTDNGCGMGRDDAILCFESHATSKIFDWNDLKSIGTLGFRGEALASIASVSRVTLSTSTPGQSAGTEVVIEGGTLRDVKDCAPIPGASIQVKSLFYNTPARRKFLRSENVEASHSREAVVVQALGRPDTGFKLVRDGKPVFESQGGENNRFGDRIGELFGESLLTELTPVKCAGAGMDIEGFVSRPGISRANRAYQYVFINGRYARDRLIGKAIMEGYRSLMPRGRFPAIFLRLTIAHERVDVNVSPTKTEVRFADGSSVFELVKQGVTNALRAVLNSGRSDFAPVGVSFTADSFATPDEHGARQDEIGFHEAVAAIHPGQAGIKPHTENEEGQYAPSPSPDVVIPPERGAELLHFDSAISKNFAIVGQVFRSFILLEEEDRLLLLDQHTVSERINFEKLSTKYGEGQVDSQELLFPTHLELAKHYSEPLSNLVGQFERLGFFIEPFGDTAFALRAVPHLLLEKDYKSVIVDMLDKVPHQNGAIDNLDKVAGDVINVMACRSAVKAGQALSGAEIESLVNQLTLCKLPYTCPHGRPVALTLEKDYLLKGFLRK